ncbi:MAG: hypothetical protein IK144_12115 [Bacteroidaceae bacterium]|nr:hypothetical protein [Bacteroidaceae bacterium]
MNNKHYLIVICIAACIILASCRTTKTVTSVEQHRVQTLMDRMDSVINTRQVIRQDSSWRELLMSQFQSIRERNDTSRTFVVDSAGKVIKETTIIRIEKETNSETDRQEREVMMSRLEIMDSTLSVMRQQLQHSDSLLQLRQTTIEKQVEKPLSRWQQIRLYLANIILIALAIAAGVWAFRKRVWWLSFFRK